MADRVPDELTGVFNRMAGLLFTEETLQGALDLGVELAHEAIAGTTGAGVTLVRNGKKSTAAYSSDIVREADARQYELDEGPCLSAWRDKRSYRIDDMTTERRWPRWTPRASQLGMASVLSVPLMVRDDSLGAVKVYSVTKQAYDDRDERVLKMFSDHAAILLANAQAYADAQELSEQLKEALKTRQTIGQAMGMLMEREGIDEEAAFGMLRHASQNNNVKLREIAREVVQSAQRAPR